ncbi:MAG: hypothetical protein NVS9B4_00110 [Candidatus Acidiferrum sp.]
MHRELILIFVVAAFVAFACWRILRSDPQREARNRALREGAAARRWQRWTWME